ncbi:MAG: hypothetical protein JRG70_20415, partial [Deltaproteobacteria bacterium]|nr:hypothetical protein [Deltaproteobacteria bacterium]
LWCDLRVVAEDAVLGVFCRRFGVPLIDLGTIRLPRLIGHSRAMDLILTGRPVPAKEAALIGLANRIAPTGQALDAALDLANEIASHPQQCMRSDRRSAIEQWGMSENEAMRNELDLGLKTIESGETVTGATRFTKGAGRQKKVHMWSVASRSRVVLPWPTASKVGPVALPGQVWPPSSTVHSSTSASHPVHALHVLSPFWNTSSVSEEQPLPCAQASALSEPRS